MKCPSCQHENLPGVKFCAECGARLAFSCPSCRTPVAQGQKFCSECGCRLDAAPEAASAPSPEAYTPKHLAERILSSRSAVQGERKQVTVLFADLKGSMELLADRDPEEAKKILAPVIERMMEAVHRYEGTVNQILGDGIMALFGAPLALEDHAVRACYAALSMHSSIKVYSDSLVRSEGVPPVQIRVGINSGEVVVGGVGSDLRMEYTAVGQTTHLAARMEQLAAPGTTRLTASTLRSAEAFVRVSSIGAVPVKGLSEPIEVYELIGASAARTRFEASATRGLTQFVGRSSEFDVLIGTMEKVCRGQGEIVALVGEPGVGKSRLVWEAAHSHHVHDCLVLESGSVSYGKATAWRPVIDLLKAYFQIEERDDPRRIREKLIGKLLNLDRQLEPMLSPLLFLLHVPVDDAQWERLDPPQRRQRILEGCKRLLLREAMVQPLLLIFEDLHWIDNETQTFLDSLVESLPHARVFLLVNYRPEYQQKWVGKTYYTQLHIDPLTGESAEALLGALVGNDASLQPLKRLLIERTGGNPLFLEESVRTLVETGELNGNRGAYRLATPISNIQVPPTVQAILASRIDRLNIEDKRLLQAAAVVGTDVPYPLLRGIAGLPEEALQRGLGNLQAAEFLYEASLFPDLEYTFKHALTHEVAYGSLLGDHRRALHGRIVEEMERLYPERLEEHVEHLGHHALRAELWEQAARYLQQAGEKAAARSANREAVTLFEQALRALAHLAERMHLEQAVDLRFRIRTCLIQLGALEQIRHTLQDAERVARELGDMRRLGWVHTYLAHYYMAAASPQQGIRLGEMALKAAEDHKDFALTVATRFVLGLNQSRLGNWNAAAAFYSSNITALTADDRQHYGLAGPASAWSRSVLVQCLAELGRFPEGKSLSEEAIRIARETNHSYALSGAYQNLGWLYMRKGEWTNAIECLEQAVNIARSRDLPFFAMQNSVALGAVLTLTDRLDEAEELLTKGVAFAVNVGLTLYRAMYTTWLAQFDLQKGLIVEARHKATQALEIAREHKEAGSEAWALRLIGDIHTRSEETGRARDCYREALAIANRLQMRPLASHCHLSLGRLLLGEHREGARDEILRAAEMYREMDMQFYLQQAETQLSATD